MSKKVAGNKKILDEFNRGLALIQKAGPENGKPDEKPGDDKSRETDYSPDELSH